MLEPDYPIETARLSLRPFTLDDLGPYHALHRLPEVARYLYNAPLDREQASVALEAKASRTVVHDEGDRLDLAVMLTETEAMIGEVNLMFRSREHARGEVGFVLDPAFHGRGFATEAAREMLRLGFDGLDLHRIIGRCDGRNSSSARVLERLGMRREAHLVENEFVKGEWTDELEYAMLKREWRALSAGA